MRALIFPGQGSQQLGMGASLARSSRAAAEVFARADAALGLPLAQICFEGPDDALRQTEVAQPAILATSIAALRAVEERAGLPFEVVLGHSLGEWSALVAANVLELEDALRLVHRRGKAMQAAVADGVGAMAAVIGLAAADVDALCAQAAGDEVLAVATDNGPGNVVVSGNAAAVQRLAALALRSGAQKVLPLSVSAPFHCALMAPAALDLARALEAVRLQPPSSRFISTVSACLETDPTRISSLLVHQVVAPVRFAEATSTAAALGADSALALGPASALKGMVRRIAPRIKVQIVETDDDL